MYLNFKYIFYVSYLKVILQTVLNEILQFKKKAIRHRWKWNDLPITQHLFQLYINKTGSS